MPIIYSHLVWLGANTAREPADILNTANNISLFEARETACKKLQQKFPQDNVSVIQALLTATQSNVNFTEYNLAEFSATQKATGLKSLFPGIKAINSEPMTGTAINDAINALNLLDDNNLLIIDILDKNLALLTALETAKQLHLFRTISIQGACEPLYENAAINEEVINFLETHGYLLQKTTGNDPDLPWLSFRLNPLWSKLQKSQQNNSLLTQELAELRQSFVQQLNEQKQKLATATDQTTQNQKKLQQQQARLHELENTLSLTKKAKQAAEQQLANCKQLLATAQQELSATKHSVEQTTYDTNKLRQTFEQQLADQKQELEAANAENFLSKQELTQQQNQLNELKIALDTANKAKQDNEQQLAACKELLTATQQELETTKRNKEQVKSDSTQVRQDLEQQLIAAQQELEIHKQTTEQEKAQRVQQLEAANKTKHDAEQKIAALKQQLATAQQETTKVQQELTQTKTQLQQQQTESDVKQALEQQLQKMFTDQAQQFTKEVGNIKNYINTGLGNTARQLEAFMGIQNYLEKGIKPLSFHGWPISPDIGLYIAGLIDANNYDVIIEFGSGTSTVLMAKALISKQRGVQTKALANTSQSNEVAVQDQTFTDLPARIVTFEHNSLYHGKTTQALKDNGVDHLVDLVHAPLVDYQYKDGSQYLYYNCNEKLQELAKIFKGRKANILVLVDGPPGATNKNARFPALPHLINNLPEHSFTIIMDDYNRAEEKETMELWKKISEERCLNPALEIIPSEKGLACIRLNSL